MLPVNGILMRPRFSLGSHLDTVLDAGRSDGIAGVLMALEVVRLLRTPGDGPARTELPFALEADVFSDEEGTRRQSAARPRRAGIWDEDWWGLTDQNGNTARGLSRFWFPIHPAGEAAYRPR